MIYQLVKRRLPWKFAIALSAIFTAAGFVSPPVGISIFSFGIALLAVPKLGRRRCSAFEAALPIRGRDLLLSRLLTDIIAVGLISMPMLGEVFVAHRHRHAAAVLFCEVGAILIVAMVAMQYRDVRAFSPPRWWQSSVWAVAIVAMFAVLVPTMQAGFLFAPLALTICVFAAAALIAYGLLARILTWAPESFEIAPRPPASKEARTKRSWLPSFAWIPLLRMTWSFGFIFLFCALLTSTAADLWLTGLFALFLTNSILSTVRNFSWLFALPISRHKIFLLLCLSAAIGIGLGASVHLPRTPRSPEVIFFDCAIVSIVFFLSIVALRPAAQRRRFPGRFLLAQGLAVSPLLLVLVLFLLGHNPMRISLGRELAANIPDHVASWMALTLSLVALSYWLAYRSFSGLEVQALPIDPFAKSKR